jgi:GDP-4-dehydro-6-deoxy-D-mannose reductase
MKALITGVTGFVGGFLAEHLLASGDRVLGCSTQAVWPYWAPSALRDRVPLLRWDLGYDAGLSDESQQRIADFAPDCIYHLAALSVPADCGKDEPAPSAVAVNVEGTNRVLELAASLTVCPRVLFTSTSHVYASVTSEQFRVDESAPVGPRNGYGRTKLAAEGRIGDWVLRNGLDAIVARSFQHTGPRQGPRLMLPEWACQLVCPGLEPIRVRNLDTWIDLSDVRDVVRAYRLLVLHGRCGETYNVGSGAARRTGDVLDVLLRLAEGGRTVVEDAPGERWDPVADNRKLVADTGWQPQIPLETTVHDTFDYWREGLNRPTTDQGN